MVFSVASRLAGYERNGRPRVLHVARNFPNVVLPRLGLWTERLVRSTHSEFDAEVVAPVPYWPPVPGPADFARFRKVQTKTTCGAATVHHPRFLTGPGSWTSEFEGIPFGVALRRAARRIHREKPFDLV